MNGHERGIRGVRYAYTVEQCYDDSVRKRGYRSVIGIAVLCQQCKSKPMLTPLPIHKKKEQKIKKNFDKLVQIRARLR